MELEDKKQIMLKKHLIDRDIYDKNVLNAMSKVKREIFVPSNQRSHSYDDNPLPIGHNQTISQPYIVAYMTQMLMINKSHEVMEIGTGCGYQTAILCKLAKNVYSIERIKELSLKARENLRFLGIENVICVTGDGNKGIKEYSPYDRIIVTAAPEKIPPELINQLKTGGIMIIPVGKIRGVQELLQIKKTEKGYDKKHLCYVRFVPMIIEDERNN